VTFDAATNRQTGVNYDANGNPTDGKVYDVENRLIAEPGYQTYAYDYRGKRITKLSGSTTELYLYGIDGRKVATYQCSTGPNPYQFSCGSPTFDTYWKGKLVKSKGWEVTTDRLGSVRWARDDGWRAYYPYGEERWGSNDNREKFGTYVRDNSEQDYADHRYYGPGTGRFFTPDPYKATPISPTNPRISGSWNRFVYANDDPINGIDPLGWATWIETGGVFVYTGDFDGEESNATGQTLVWNAKTKTWEAPTPPPPPGQPPEPGPGDDDDPGGNTPPGTPVPPVTLGGTPTPDQAKAAADERKRTCDEINKAKNVLGLVAASFALVEKAAGWAGGTTTGMFTEAYAATSAASGVAAAASIVAWEAGAAAVAFTFMYYALGCDH
jgi:RHS repeat-associated protein